MKTLNKYLIEALISRNTEIQTYNFQPKDFDELRDLLEQLLEERGPDANLNDIDVSQVTSFGDYIKRGKYHGKWGLFYGLDPHNIKIDRWNVNNIENMSYMFYNCTNFTGHGLENWKPIKCKDMRFMFKDCNKFNCNLSKWNVSNIDRGRMKDMFKGCTSLKNKPSWYKK